jgi:RNA polymerase sigma factor (sigma-70 family)
VTTSLGRHETVGQCAGRRQVLFSPVTNEQSDAELLAAIRAGDARAWSGLVHRHGGRVWAIARAQGLSAELSADVVQTVWLVLLDSLSSIRNDDSIRFWLATVARHEAIRLSIRQRRLGDERALSYLADPSSSDAEARVDQHDQIAAVRNALRKLSDRCRELLHVLFSDIEFSYREIADLLGRPIGSLGAQRARCLDQLRDLLDA